MDLAVFAHGFNTMDVPSPCAAWMTPIGSERGDPISFNVQYDEHEHTFSFGGKELAITYGVLRAASIEPEAVVRRVDGKHYAVLKRGLLELVVLVITTVFCCCFLFWFHLCVSKPVKVKSNLPRTPLCSTMLFFPADEPSNVNKTWLFQLSVVSVSLYC